MKTYIGTKIIDAEPMTRGDYNDFRGWELPPDENGDDQGFLKNDGNGHIQWDPKNVFERNSFQIAGERNKITQADVDRMIADTKVMTIGDKTTFVQVTLLNGFTLEETSSCVDPENYDKAMGAEICLEKLKDKVWFLLGFLLQSALYGFSGGDK